ncbi:ribosome maturation factor RimP [Larkinella knui]|uniref:Ribosome maturation factor RimP n=1 Tax=Larkinella knui TaxID=2025310 RepID=A0A3P1CDU6_9BACT|nr:ribosome maturation factor RimP [Larkinella knui]RRB11477.1 ribosome maturation factor RimP [Larkinella knui]
MDVKAKVNELLQPYLNEDQYFVVDIQVSPSRTRAKITVLLDSDTGITIEECAGISRKLGNQLEELEVFDGQSFTLEVSSPGVDEPLVLKRQYLKNVGREIQVLLNDGQIRSGKLEHIGEDHIVITETPLKKPKKNDPPIEPAAIPFTYIKKSTIQVSFK